MLIGIHESLALWTGAPEFKLDAAEASLLADSAAKVARWYALPGIAQKTLDWTNLALALNVVYGSRLAVYRMRKTAERRASKPAPSPQPATSGPVANAPAPRSATPGAPSAPMNGGSPPIGKQNAAGLDLDDPRFAFPAGEIGI